MENLGIAMNRVGSALTEKENDTIKKEVCNMERRMFGEWVLFTIEPETEAGKADYVSVAVEKLLHSMVDHGVVPDWGTMQIIIKEGYDIFGGPDWYEDEKEDYKGPYGGWAMTVGIKFYSENYPE